MSAKRDEVAQGPQGRIMHVHKSAEVFVRTMLGQLTLEHIEKFAKTAEEAAHIKGRQFVQFLKSEQDSTESALTEHAAHMRTLAAQIILLRDGFVPALKVDKDSHPMMIQAVSIMGFIRAEFEAMDGGIR